MRFQALPGFRDFYPEEMALRRHVENAWHAASRAAGFEEVDGPPLESLDLFKAKSGAAIVEQLYTFKDKGERWVALRAELTPTLARMVGARAAALPKPVKWYAVPQLFRYERQQRGRLREHLQWNLDVVGAPEVGAEAEAVAVALDALRRLGLTEEDVYVRVSHRSLVENKILALGFPEKDVEPLLQLIDKGMLGVQVGMQLAGKPEAYKELIDWLDRPEEPADELGLFLAACDDYGIGGYVEVDKHIVRGLAYYTGTVFEIFDRGKKLRAVAGGGRYDRLIERLGGPSLPALGFGMGDVVLSELLKDLGKLPAHPPRIDALVLPIGGAMAGPARRVVRRLRDAGLAAEAPYAPARVGKAIKAAEGAGATRVYFVGPDEWKDESVKVKDLASGEERVVRVDALP